MCSPCPLGVLSGNQYLVDQTVLYRVFRAEEKIALGVAADDLDRLLGMAGEDLVLALAQGEDLLGVDLDVGRLAVAARHRLAVHHALIRALEALATRVVAPEESI